MAKRWVRWVHVDVKIYAQRYAVDVQRMEIGYVF
jgi:hypothetical protein